MKIIVHSEEAKQALLEESRYIHDLRNIDTDKCSTLTHLYLAPDIIVVEPT